MKKKFRKICVHNVPYGYTVSDGDNNHTLTVWADKKPLFQVEVKSPAVTPGIVRKHIEDHFEHVPAESP